MVMPRSLHFKTTAAYRVVSHPIEHDSTLTSVVAVTIYEPMMRIAARTPSFG